MRFSRFGLYLGFGSLFALGFGCASLARGQEHDGHVGSLPIVVNGAETPDRIPDTLAYAHFFIAVAEPDEPSPAQVARRKALMAPVGLSKRDETALVDALKGLRADLDRIAEEVREMSAAPSPSQRRLLDLRLERTRALGEARTRVVTALSADGAPRLANYIRTSVKPKIAIYGDPR